MRCKVAELPFGQGFSTEKYRAPAIRRLRRYRMSATAEPRSILLIRT